MAVTYLINSVFGRVNKNTKSYFAGFSRYRLIITLWALIALDHSFEYRIEKDIKQLIRLKNAFAKVHKDEEIQFIIQKSKDQQRSKFIE